MHSGSPLACWSLRKDSKDVAYHLGSLLDDNFSIKNSSQELLTLLKMTNASIIKEKSMFVVSWITLPQNTHIYRYILIQKPSHVGNCYDVFSGTVFTPVEEPENETNAIFYGFAHERIRNGESMRVPMLIGINSQEMLLFSGK